MLACPSPSRQSQGLRRDLGWGLLFLVLLLAVAPGAATAQETPEPQPEETQPEETPSEETQAEEATSEAAASEPSDADPDAEEQEPEEEDDRFFMERGLSEEDGGGKVVVRFDDFRSAENGDDLFLGNVEFTYQDIKVTADQVTLNREEETLFAEGNVVFDQGPRRLVGKTLQFDLDEKLGELTEVQGALSTEYFFTGSRVAKVGENTYEIEDGIFTSCEGFPPAWSFRAKRIKVTVDGYAKARGATLRAKKLPVLYFPYVLWPAKADRTSGFLVAKPGYSQRRGASLGLAYYQTLGRSADTTINVDVFGGGASDASADGATSGNFLGIGNEFRYRPSEGTSGLFEGYAIRDPERDNDWRWRIRYDHESKNLPLGFRGVVSIVDVSDFDFFQDFERRADRNSQRRIYSRGFLTKNWGANSLNVLFDDREAIVGSSGDTVTLRQAPEIEYKLRSTRLGKTPLYLALQSSFHFLDMDRSEALDNTYQRADVFPEITLPWRAKPWLSLSFTVGSRFTWYGDSLLTGAEQAETDQVSRFSGDNITRFVPTAAAEIVGPSFSRIYETDGKKFSKYKHVIEPRINYGFFDEYDDQDRIPLFDEIDNLRGRNVTRFSLFNRLLAKPTDESQGGAREIMLLQVFQDYSFDAETPLQASSDGLQERSTGPLTALYRYNPSRRTSVRTEVAYNTLFGEISRTALSTSFDIGKNSAFGLRWTTRTNPETGETRSNQVRASWSLPIIPRRLDFRAQANYDIERSIMQLQRYLLNFRGSCYTMSLEVADFQTGNREDLEYRFLLTLKGVGTFLDITGGNSESL
ncbi:MAG: LPS assembly protein LptD [Acidobacteriota bacterium]